MKLLLDTCVWGGATKTLEASGHDVVWTGDWSEDPGDEEILAKAHYEGRILVTLDKDFGEIAIVKGKPHSGILRLVNLSANQQGIVCLRVIQAYGQVLQKIINQVIKPLRVYRKTKKPEHPSSVESPASPFQIPSPPSFPTSPLLSFRLFPFTFPIGGLPRMKIVTLVPLFF